MGERRREDDDWVAVQPYGPGLSGLSGLSGVVSSGFTLQGIPGKMIWLDAGKATGSPADKSLISPSQLADQSGNGNNPTAVSEGSINPVYYANVGGHPAVRFEYTGFVCPSIFPGSTSWTKIGVVSYDANLSSGMTGGTVWGDSAANLHTIRLTSATTIRAKYNGNATDYSLIGQPAGYNFINLNTPYLFVFSYDAVAQVTKVYLNGLMVGTQSGVAPGTPGNQALLVADTTPTEGLVLGGYFFEGMLVDHAMSAADVASLTAIYNTKYNLGTAYLTFPPAGVTLLYWGDPNIQVHQFTQFNIAVADGDPVGIMWDQSGNARNLLNLVSQATCPLLRTRANGKNNLNILQFDGATQNLLFTNGAVQAGTANGLNTIDNLAGATWFLVAQLPGNPASGTNTRAFGFSEHASPGTVRASFSPVGLQCRTLDTDGRHDVLPAYTYTGPNEWLLMTLVFDYTNNLGTVRVNGVQTGTGTLGTPGNSDPGDALIGGHSSAGFGGGMPASNFGDVMIANGVLSLANIQAIEAYLNAKWAVY
jgi:hypothetical protein